MADADVKSGRQVKEKNENKKNAGKAPDFSSTCCWFFYQGQQKVTISSQQAVSQLAFVGTVDNSFRKQSKEFNFSI